MQAESQNIYPKGTYQLLLFCQAESVYLYNVSNLKTNWVIQSATILEILKCIENDMCMNKFPQNSNKYRMWDNRIHPEHLTDITTKANFESTKTEQGFHIHKFIIRIISLQNVTWQGAVQWIDGRKTMFFRSLNELLCLLYEAVFDNH
jgi:hypothetical protein